MAGFNHCVFVGRIGIEPELRETNEGVSYCRFRLAMDQGRQSSHLHVALQLDAVESLHSPGYPGLVCCPCVFLENKARRE